MEMTIERIREMQASAGLDEFQRLIETGDVWQMEGLLGRQAMTHLKTGACFLPNRQTKDHYGNPIPSRDEVLPGTAGSLSLSMDFWDNYPSDLWEDAIIEEE